jgi:hypothetical protein
MDQATLVGPDLSFGRDIISVLEDAQIKPILALFALFPEYSDWRLVISSPALDQDHSLKAGKMVHSILQGKFYEALPPIMILPAKDSFIRSLKAILLGKAKFGNVTILARNLKSGGTGTVRFRDAKIGNRIVSEAIVFRA